MPFDLDRSGLAWLYETQSAAMLVYFTRRCYDAQLALDLVGETFASAQAECRRFRGASEAEAVAWVWAIGRNALTDALRRGHAESRALRRIGVQSPVLADAELHRVEELAGLADLQAVVAAAMEGLAPQQRDALRLRVVEELSYAEVAARLAISQGAARARISRGLRALGAALDVSEGRA
jgi:RNA polymerase sigma factor (sigma-70 family)